MPNMYASTHMCPSTLMRASLIQAWKLMRASLIKIVLFASFVCTQRHSVCKQHPQRDTLAEQPYNLLHLRILLFELLILPTYLPFLHFERIHNVPVIIAEPFQFVFNVLEALVQAIGTWFWQFAWRWCWWCWQITLWCWFVERTPCIATATTVTMTLTYQRDWAWCCWWWRNCCRFWRCYLGCCCRFWRLGCCLEPPRFITGDAAEWSMLLPAHGLGLSLVVVL